MSILLRSAALPQSLAILWATALGFAPALAADCVHYEDYLRPVGDVGLPGIPGDVFVSGPQAYVTV